MVQRMRGGKGFTLIELMIVVAILSILAAIAIPNFVAMQLRSKRSELPSNLDGIRTAEIAYHTEWDVFTTCVLTPAVQPHKEAVAFGNTYGDGSTWDLVGWLPDGFVRGQYQVLASNGVFATGLGDEGSIVDGLEDDPDVKFTATGLGDIDGDNDNSRFVATNKLKPLMMTPNSAY